MKPLDHDSVQFVEIKDDQAGQRIDNFLIARLKGVPKSRIYRILRKGEVRVNKGRVKPEFRLSGGDMVRLPPIRVAERAGPVVPGQGLQQLLKDSVLYEDADLLVINKPAGLAVHGGSGISLGLIEALRGMRPDEAFLELVHRLDRGTSGCLLIAKKRSALRFLQDQMRMHSNKQDKVEKVYQALVCGRWEKGRAKVEAPLLKTSVGLDGMRVKADVTGKPSVTHFRLLKSFSDASLVEATLETGRTHQIRVHSQLAGHPLAGDDKYGDEKFNSKMKQFGLKRMFLHAISLTFLHPKGGRVSVEAPLPEELQVVLSGLKEAGLKA